MRPRRFPDTPVPLCHAVLPVLGVLVAGLPAQEAERPEPIRKTGQYYELVVDGGDRAVATAALEAAEAAWPLAAELLRAGGAAAPKQPLAVHLYHTVEGYEAAEERLTGGRFRRNLAMSHWDTKTAHVALQPPCSGEALRAVGLPGLTIELLAWEACHLARYELFSNFRAHPDWFADGLASWVAGQVLDQRHPGAGAPKRSTYLVRLQRLQRGDKLPPASAILADTISDLDLQDRYAARAVFFQFLAQRHAEALPRIAVVVRRTPEGPRHLATVAGAARRMLGSSLDRDFATFVREAQPRWDEVIRSLTTGPEDWHQIAFPDNNAIAWNLAPVGGGGLHAQGTLRILPGGRQQLNFLLGRTDDGFLSIAFVADRGFTVFDYRSATGAWHPLGDAHAPALRLGIATDFAVKAAGTSLTVHVEEHHWEYELPRPLPDQVFWGLGAQAGSAGLWRNLEATAPAR